MAIDESSASATDVDARRMLAVALKYSPGEAAPTVVAKGRGLLAEEIIARAREHGIYVHESPALVALLEAKLAGAGDDGVGDAHGQ